MATLWCKFPDEAMFYRRFTAAEKKVLEDVFSNAEGSPWRRALALLGLAPVNEKLITWHEDIPYVNASAFIALASGGAAQAVKTEEGGHESRVSGFWKLIRAQWKVERFLARPSGGDKIAESLALGLCLQFLMAQGNMARMQVVQLRRTALSGAWNEVFPGWTNEGDTPEGLPEFFWDTPTAGTSKVAAKPVGASGGQAVGRAVTDMKNIPQDGAPRILVFRQARPETVELFEHAAGLVFCEGGVLSHACTVARERNIPAVTGVGRAFMDYLASLPDPWLSIDGGAGRIEVIKSQGTSAG